MSSERIGSGKTLTGQSREIVYNVFNYFMRHHNKKSDGGDRLKKDLYGWTSEATSVSQRSVQQVVCEVRNQVVAAVEASTSQQSTSGEGEPQHLKHCCLKLRLEHRVKSKYIPEKYIQLELKVDNFTDSFIITLGNSDGESRDQVLRAVKV
ncbi:unnamed protein product [Parnassius apollo]|uniref:(apollo) hypothetical protein n=1 Tax=Parnassius apollo TaxID=110799 RepID=A0A8S3XP89_PARAO|nr:unnamed protein product [Parnassius apollo]